MPTKARHCVLLSLFCNWRAQFKVFQFHLDWFLIVLCIFSCMVNDPCLPQETVREPMEFAHCALLASIHRCNGLWPCGLSHFIGDFYGDFIFFVPPDPHFVWLFSTGLSIFLFVCVLFLNAECMTCITWFLKVKNLISFSFELFNICAVRLPFNFKFSSCFIFVGLKQISAAVFN